MPHFKKLINIKVEGDFACFTTWDSKIDRFTYSILTPTAARGILECVHWKPEMYYEIHEIWNLKPVKYETCVIKERKENGVQTRKVETFLFDVAYLIRTLVVARDGLEQTEAKHRDIIQRNLRNGKYKKIPYLGQTGKNVSNIELVSENELINIVPHKLPGDEHVGRMVASLYDLDIQNNKNFKNCIQNRKTFVPEVKNGIYKIKNPTIYTSQWKETNNDNR